MIKILAIGNSFSEDATQYLEMFDSGLFVRNLYIGGCSLERHVQEIKDNTANYVYEHNAYSGKLNKVTVLDGVLAEEWDYITVQQVSGLSGIKKSYYPYLNELINFIKKHSKAKIVMHQTWAYEHGCDWQGFVNYGNDQAVMADMILKTTYEIAKCENLPLIEVGAVINNMRKHKFFDVKNGGVSLCRDGAHLDVSLGRFTASAVWYKFFKGKLPEYLNRTDLSEGYKILKEELENFNFKYPLV